MDKILIFTGPSERGWHRVESMLRCPTLYAFKQAGGEEEEERGPLVRGSLGHVGLAHYYARLGALQHGKDPEAYYEPSDAIEIVGKQMGGLALTFIESMQRLILAYHAHYAGERMTVKEIEVPVEMLFNGRHRMTQRFDLVVTDANGRCYVWDHKVVSKIDGKTQHRYDLSGQFLEMHWQGRNRYGDAFAGLRVNLLQADGSKFVRVTPDPAPAALQKFPDTVAHGEDLIERYKDLAPFDYPRTFSEQTCMTAYGRCPAWDFCRWGPAKR